MPLQVLPFTDAHLEAAGALLAARHRRDRRRRPALPRRFEEPSAARTALAAVRTGAGASGVVALRRERLIGYLIGSPTAIAPEHPFAPFVRPRAAEIPIAGHAVAPEDAREVYPVLYAELATHWLAAGLGAHYIRIPADDRMALDSWFTLAFGHDLTLAVRDTSPVASSPVTVRRATSADVDVLAEQAVATLDGFTAPPTMLPPPPGRANVAMRDWIGELLADAALAQWVALQGSDMVGMKLFDKSDRHVDELLTPEQSIYLLGAYTSPRARRPGIGGALLAKSLQCARNAGHNWCVLDYLPANLAGARFWSGTTSNLWHIGSTASWMNGFSLACDSLLTPNPRG